MNANEMQKKLYEYDGIRGQIKQCENTLKLLEVDTCQIDVRVSTMCENEMVMNAEKELKMVVISVVLDRIVDLKKRLESIKNELGIE